MSKKSKSIQHYILRNISEYSEGFVSLAVKKFKVTRQNINKHLGKLMADGFLEIEGRTKGARYRLRNLVDESFTLEKSIWLYEDAVWRDQVAPLLGKVPRNVLDICRDGFIRMLNNAIVHSDSEVIRVRVQQNAVDVKIVVDDDGIGIFKKIQGEFNLPNRRDAILELSKGKLTTDEEHHSGEGIFSVGKSFDVLIIYSGKFLFFKKGDDTCEIIEEERQKDGTYVSMKIALDSRKTLKSRGTAPKAPSRVTTLAAHKEYTLSE